MAKEKETPTLKNIIEKTLDELAQEKIIETTKPIKNVPTLAFNSDGVMGSTTTNPDNTKMENVVFTENPVSTKVALFSTRNMYAEGGPGKLNIGYNIVSKKHVDFWLSMNGVRLATPEEVAEAFG